MQRKTQTQLNITVAMVRQLVTTLCGLILPRFILTSYGSAANGLMQSIGQILTYTTLMEGGVGGVVMASLYKPLAENNDEEISDIFNHTKRFFARISMVFCVFALLLSCTAKLIIVTDFDFVYVGAMVLILALNTYFNYYFGLPHQLLLQADQKLYVVQLVQMSTTVLNLVLCIFAISMNAPVHFVKFITAFVFLLNPIVYRTYVKRHYRISKRIYDETHNLTQKSDAMIHHISYFIHRNTDIVILSIFKGVYSVSVYSVYNAVCLAIEQLLCEISSALAGAIGNIMAKGEKATLKNSFELYEAVNTFLTTAFFTIAAVLILPFVSLYTKGVTDTEYIQPAFAYTLVAAGAMYCVRLPYSTILTSGGLYKETKAGALGEVCLNLMLSILLVKPMGLVGVALGSFAATAYRTTYMVWYLSKNILYRKMVKFAVSFSVNTAAAVAIIAVFNKYVTISTVSYLSFFADSFKAAVIVGVLLLLINTLLWFLSGKKLQFKEERG